MSFVLICIVVYISDAKPTPFEGEQYKKCPPGVLRTPGNVCHTDSPQNNQCPDGYVFLSGTCRPGSF